MYMIFYIFQIFKFNINKYILDNFEKQIKVKEKWKQEEYGKEELLRAEKDRQMPG
jgi:hypothetical protein